VTKERQAVSLCFGNASRCRETWSVTSICSSFCDGWPIGLKETELSKWRMGTWLANKLRTTNNYEDKITKRN
jgi:hypothetical protein